MKDIRETAAGFGGMTNDAVAAKIAATRRRRIWEIVVVANVFAVIAAIAGCLLMMKTQGVKADVADMRNEVGETLTVMAVRDANEAVAKHLPHLIDTVSRWERKFSEKREGFRGLDLEINQVQEMSRLGRIVECWRKELEGISPMQRGELWQRGLKAQVEAEQKKWPNRTHEKSVTEWFKDVGKEFWFGAWHGVIWPVGLYERMAERIKGKGAAASLSPGLCLRYLLFPYRLSSFTMLRLTGIVVATSGLGYFLCWVGLKVRLEWLSYVGLVYFLYLLIIVLFILGLEVAE